MAQCLSPRRTFHRPARWYVVSGERDVKLARVSHALPYENP